MREGVVMHPLKPVQRPLFAGKFVGQQQGVQGFGVRPPDFAVGKIPPRLAPFRIQAQ